MNNTLAALISGSLACVVVCGQSRHTVDVCDLTTINNVNDCYPLESSTIGRLKFEDYKVTNPLAVQFDPAIRQQELAALGSSTAATLCHTPPAFAGQAPSISFEKSTVAGQIYWIPVGPANGDPFEFVDVQFSNFTASNGYSSPRFGFRMIREITKDGVEVPDYQIQLQVGNPGLENVAVPPPGLGFHINGVLKTATEFGPLPSSDLLRDAMFGVFVDAKSILDAAKFTITTPAPAGRKLWDGTELSLLAGEMGPLIAAAQDVRVPLGPAVNCHPGPNGYGPCDGDDQITAFSNMLLTWGGEYLGLRTKRSFTVLVDNLRFWATANAPGIDPVYALSANGASSFELKKRAISKPLAMLWPTLRADPALSASDSQIIEDWLTKWLLPPAPRSAIFPNTDYFPNDLGDYADSILMADAIRRSDHAGFAFGIQRYYGALLQMRADGSLPLSARLSACSAVYTNVDITHLVSIAEMAATQGYDLYSLSVNGKTVHTAIQFLLDARDNPALLYQYSKAGGGACFTGNPGDPPDFDLVFGPGSQANLTWVEPYLARFPFTPIAARLRTIMGSKVSAPPFPLKNDYLGLNATCAYRKSYEFQPVNGVKVAIVSGDGQTAGPNQPSPAPLSVRVTDSSEKALAGVLVSFAVTQGSANLSSPAQILTDPAGLASATVAVAGGPVTVTATALGVPASFAIAVPSMAIYSGGIVGIGGSVPGLSSISAGALFSIFGQNFAPAGTGRRVNPDELINGALPTTLLGVCVSAAGQRTPILDVYPGQINAVAPILTPNSMVDAIVTTGCGTPDAVQSMPQSVTVAPVSPEFLYFAYNANGVNPVAALNSVTGAYVGPAELGTGFAPAHAGDLVTIFASGFGPPPTIPGAPATGPSEVKTVTVRLGPVTLDAKDVLYAGAAPGQLISQLNIRIPEGIPCGNQPLQIRFNAPVVTSLPGAFLAIAAP